MSDVFNITDICERCPAPIPQLCCKDALTFRVLLTPEEAERIASRTNREVEEFAYPALLEPNRYELKKPCTFLRDGRCSIHSFKPEDCRMFVCGWAITFRTESDPAYPLKLLAELLQFRGAG